MNAHDAAAMPRATRFAESTPPFDGAFASTEHGDHGSVLDLVKRFGGATSYVAADPSCNRFRVHGIDGLIPFRTGPRCRVAFGDPVCSPGQADQLAEHFRSACEREHLSLVYAAAGEAFATSICPIPSAR